MSTIQTRRVHSLASCVECRRPPLWFDRVRWCAGCSVARAAKCSILDAPRPGPGARTPHSALRRPGTDVSRSAPLLHHSLPYSEHSSLRPQQDIRSKQLLLGLGSARFLWTVFPSQAFSQHCWPDLDLDHYSTRSHFPSLSPSLQRLSTTALTTAMAHSVTGIRAPYAEGLVSSNSPAELTPAPRPRHTAHKLHLHCLPIPQPTSMVRSPRTRGRSLARRDRV